MSRRPFFVGVGAQRSGTTWLGHFLRRLPDVRFSPIKETCFFDSKYVERRRNALLLRINTRLAVLGLGNYARRYPVSGVRLCFHYLGIRRLRDESYRAFFDELARHGAVAGEITPSYAMLHKEAIGKMDALLDQPNYFFVMRNPVDRLVSQYSFLSSRRGLKAPEGRSPSEALLLLSKKSDHTNYARSLRAYRETIPNERFKVLFSEHLFAPERTQGECDALCDYLGVGRGVAEVTNQVNRAPQISVTQETRRDLVSSLAESYTHVAETFGSDLPDAWRRDLELLP